MFENRSTTTGAARRPRSGLRRRVLALLALTLAASPALVSLGPAEGLAPRGVGPRDPRQMGFPAYYTDDSGVALQMCDDGTLRCGRATNRTLRPPDGENFYWMATADMRSAGLDISIEFAAEAAWATKKAPVTFDRLRVRGHATLAGTYTVTHPYGTTTVRAIDPGEQRNIDFTQDVGCAGRNCDFKKMTNSANSHITSWIRSTAAPKGYLGNGVRATTATVAGDPASVSITGPAGTASTNRFVVMGKKANPHAVFAPSRVRFSRDRTKTVRVKNLGTGPLTIRGTQLKGSRAFHSTARSTCARGRVLAVGRSCKVGIRVGPSGGKARLLIKDNTPSGGRTVRLIAR